MLVVIFATGTITSQNISIKGFGNIPIKKEADNYLIQIGKFGEFAFQGNLESKNLTAKVQVDQLSNLPGFRVLSKLGLTDILLNISPDGLYLNAHADTKSSLKKVCDLFKITTPYIEVSAAIAPRSLELEGSMEFSDGPVEFLHIDQTGTVVKFNSASIATTLEPGTAELGFSTNVLITPTKFDPDLNCTYSFTYDLVKQTLTGAGSMMSDWVNPLGTSNFVNPNSIVFSNAAVELGINIATLAPVNIGFAVEKAKIFTLDFGVVVSIDPVDKKVAFKGERTKMNANDFSTFLREGFGLKVPNVLPDIYYIEEPRVLFSPNGGSVGEVEIEKGIALKGMMHIGDAMQGPIDFKFDMENEITLHMDLQYDFRKFVMNEVHKIKPLAPIADEVLKTFQVRKLYVDMYANKDEKNFNGMAKCDFELFGHAHHIEFEAALNPDVIVQKLVNEIKKLAAPQMLAAAKVISDNVKKVAGPALSASINIAQKGFSKLGDFGKVVAVYSDHMGHENCFKDCVRNRANHLTGTVLQASNKAVLQFYEKLHDELLPLTGVTPEQTMDLRYQAIGADWKRLMDDLDSKWIAVVNDKDYYGYDKDQDDVRKLGDEYRRYVNVKYQEHVNYRRDLWKRLLTHGDGRHQIQNGWKPNYYIHDNFSKVECATIKQEWLTAQWDFEPTGDGYVRIKNAQKGTYLHIEHGAVETSEISDGWASAQWKIERVGGSKFVRLKNRWKNTYLNIEQGSLVCTQAGAGAWSSYWDLRPMLNSVDWRSPGNWAPVEVWEPVRIKNRHKKGYLQVEQGSVHSTPVQVKWTSAKWVFEPSILPGYFRIKNLWKNTYLNVESGKLEATNIHAGAHSSLWDIQRVPGTNYVKIRNKWKHDWYIHHEWGAVECNTIQQGWHSAMWELDYDMTPTPAITVVYDAAAGCGTFYKKGIEMKKHCGWSKNWHSIVVFGTISNSFSDYKVLFYDQTNGAGAIYKVDNHGNMEKLKDHSGWATTWSKITAENGRIKFQLPNGYYEIYNCDDAGNISLEWKQKEGGEPTIMPGFTVKYDKAEGCGTFFMDGTELKKHCGWSKNWHSIVVIGCIGNSNDSHRVLFYDKDAGTADMYIVDANGNMKILKNHTGWSKNWEKITWEDQGECKGLIKFETVDGYWEKYNCNDQGNISLHSKKQ